MSNVSMINGHIDKHESEEKKRLIEILKSIPYNHERVNYDNPLVADYLLANGVIVPPCKIGDTVYQTNGTTIKEYKVDYFDIFKNSVNSTFKIHLIADNWSDFVFDREEALSKLQSSKGEEI